MVNNLAMFESPVQWMMVMVIALIVFGPKRLPEIGKQLGSALRELKKMTGDMAKTMNGEYEPDPEPYKYTPSTEYASDSTYSYEPPTETAPDMTDYTIVGVNDITPQAESDPYALAPSAIAELADPAQSDGTHIDPISSSSVDASLTDHGNVVAGVATHSETVTQGDNNV